MSPTLTDDALVRTLRERADATLPPMGLRPDAVLAAGRRHRRRRTAVRAAGTLAAVAAVAVVAGELAGIGPWDRVPVPPARADQAPEPLGDGKTVELAPGVFAVHRPVELTLAGGTTVLDLGFSIPDLTADTAGITRPLVIAPATAAQIAEANPDPERPSWDAGVQLTHLGESGITTGVPFLWRTVEASDDYAPEPGQEVPWDTVMRFTGDESGVFFGVVPAWLPGARIVMYSANGFRQDDGTLIHSVAVPVYPAPTGDGRLLYTVWIPAAADGVGGFRANVDATLAISPDGRVFGGQRCSSMTLDECAELLGPEIYAAAELITGAIDRFTIETSTDVRLIETDDGPAFDLGVQVEDDVDQFDQTHTYILIVTTLGEMEEDAALTAEERGGPAVMLSTLAADGTTSNEVGWDLATRRATSDGSPAYQASFSEHDGFLLGMLSPGSGTTLELVIEHAAGAERTPVPVFRVPGLPEDLCFVALHHAGISYTDWPTIYVELTAGDGTTTRWPVAGVEFLDKAPESTDSPTDQG
jgi:hypothetical protein